MRLVSRLFALLATLVFLTGAFGRASVAWMCEGRVCSPDLARCCCVSDEGSRDNACLRSDVDRSTDACKGQCGCKAVVTKALSATVPSKFSPSIVAPSVADVPFSAPPLLAGSAFVALASPQVRAIPPPDRLPDPPCVAHASLRAPPVATA